MQTNKQSPDFILVSVFDAQVGHYRKPMIAESMYDIIRDFEMMCQKTPEDTFVMNSEHFQLFQLGEFSKKHGLTSHEQPRHLFNFHEIKSSILAKISKLGIVGT